MESEILLNDRRYRWPKRPLVVVCADGCGPDYIAQGRRSGILPNIEAFAENGFFSEALGILPSFTNPNNLSIVTGAPASVHGIVGNYFLDPCTGQEVMMDDPKFLRCETLLAEFSRAGARTVIITAKEKLRRLLGHRLRDGICFSSEKADQYTLDENGHEKVLDFVDRPLPDVYSAELSFFVLEAGLRILQHKAPDLMYLSLTDYVEHTYAPGTKEANDFFQGLDGYLGSLVEHGALVAVTADHGMTDKCKADGTPNVVYLQEVLDQELGSEKTKVICPITDPYVVHHGSLGSFVMVYCRQSLNPSDVGNFIRGLEGVEMVLSRERASEELELPADLLGDVIVLGDAHTVLGSTRVAHDLSALRGTRLRSHGGRAEQTVPFILSHPLTPEYAARAVSRPLRNFDIFDFALNGTL